MSEVEQVPEVTDCVVLDVLDVSAGSAGSAGSPDEPPSVTSEPVASGETTDTAETTNLDKCETTDTTETTDTAETKGEAGQFGFVSPGVYHARWASVVYYNESSPFESAFAALLERALAIPIMPGTDMSNIATQLDLIAPNIYLFCTPTAETVAELRRAGFQQVYVWLQPGTVEPPTLPGAILFDHNTLHSCARFRSGWLPLMIIDLITTSTFPLYEPLREISDRRNGDYFYHGCMAVAPNFMDELLKICSSVYGEDMIERAIARGEQMLRHRQLMATRRIESALYYQLENGLKIGFVLAPDFTPNMLESAASRPVDCFVFSSLLAELSDCADESTSANGSPAQYATGQSAKKSKQAAQSAPYSSLKYVGALVKTGCAYKYHARVMYQPDSKDQIFALLRNCTKDIKHVGGRHPYFVAWFTPGQYRGLVPFS